MFGDKAGAKVKNYYFLSKLFIWFFWKIFYHILFQKLINYKRRLWKTYSSDI